MNHKKYLLIVASVIMITAIQAGCKGHADPDPPDSGSSDINNIVTFDFPFSADSYADYQKGDAAQVKFFNKKDSIYVLVPWYANIILAPQITVSPEATVSPISGSARDFSQGTVTYTVRAKSGEEKVWKVFVEWGDKPARDDNPRRKLESNNPNYRLIKIGLHGNAYATGAYLSTSGDYSTGYITNTGNPTSDASYHTIYFVARHAGELQMALRGVSGNASGNTIKIKAFVNGVQAKDDDGTTPYEHSYLYKKTGITDTITLHHLILPEIPDGQVGHQIKLEIRGSGSRAGSYYYRFYELWVSGWATSSQSGALYEGKYSGLNFSYGTPRDGRAAPSIHMNMNAPAGNMEYFYTEITVPSGCDPLYCYYMTSGNGQGYAGIQTNSLNDRRFLFSIWAACEESDNATIRAKYNPKLVRVCNQPAYRPGITYQVFGGEGTGGQSRINVMWKTGDTYKVLLRIRPHPDQVRFPNSTLYKAWFHNGTEWMFMCEWRRQEIQPGDKGVVTAKGPYWYTSASHFIEDFNGLMGYAPHKAYYSNHWFITDKGEYVEPTGYRFTGNQAQGRADVEGGVVTDPSSPFYNSIFLSSGGYFVNGKTLTNPFTKPASAVKPTLDLATLNAMGTDDPSKDSAISLGEQYTE